VYRTREFASLAGVTVRTLHHYDRLGLLHPRRSESGYRQYQARDLERLEQIVALKFLGLPLRQIRILLDRSSLELADALRLQRRVLEEKRKQLDLAIRTIQEAETSLLPGQPADSAILRKIIEAIEMQNHTDWMSKYQTPQARAKIETRQAEWTPELQARISQQWTELFADVRAALAEDPASERVQALAVRWRELVEAFTQRDPDLTASVSNAWKDRANWPADAKQHAQPFADLEVWAFMSKAMAIAKQEQNED
jgi:MerR family transcriptional regulator, thiopeptide resistance regulator